MRKQTSTKRQANSSQVKLLRAGASAGATGTNQANNSNHGKQIGGDQNSHQTAHNLSLAARIGASRKQTQPARNNWVNAPQNSNVNIARIASPKEAALSNSLGGLSLRNSTNFSTKASSRPQVPASLNSPNNKFLISAARSVRNAESRGHVTRQSGNASATTNNNVGPAQFFSGATSPTSAGTASVLAPASQIHFPRQSPTRQKQSTASSANGPKNATKTKSNTQQQQSLNFHLTSTRRQKRDNEFENQPVAASLDQTNQQVGSQFKFKSMSSGQKGANSKKLGKNGQNASSNNPNPKNKHYQSNHAAPPTLFDPKSIASLNSGSGGNQTATTASIFQNLISPSMRRGQAADIQNQMSLASGATSPQNAKNANSSAIPLSFRDEHHHQQVAPLLGNIANSGSRTIVGSRSNQRKTATSSNGNQGHQMRQSAGAIGQQQRYPHQSSSMISPKQANNHHQQPGIATMTNLMQGGNGMGMGHLNGTQTTRIRQSFNFSSNNVPADGRPTSTTATNDILRGLESFSSPKNILQQTQQTQQSQMAQMMQNFKKMASNSNQIRDEDLRAVNRSQQLVSGGQFGAQNSNKRPTTASRGSKVTSQHNTHHHGTASSGATTRTTKKFIRNSLRQSDAQKMFKQDLMAGQQQFSQIGVNEAAEMLFQSHSLPRSPQNTNNPQQSNQLGNITTMNPLTQVTSVDELNFLTKNTGSRVNSTKNSNLRSGSNEHNGGAKKRKLAINSRQQAAQMISGHQQQSKKGSHSSGYALKAADHTRPLSGNQRVKTTSAGASSFSQSKDLGQRAQNLSFLSGGNKKSSNIQSPKSGGVGLLEAILPNSTKNASNSSRPQKQLNSSQLKQASETNQRFIVFQDDQIIDSQQMYSQQHHRSKQQASNQQNHNHNHKNSSGLHHLNSINSTNFGNQIDMNNTAAGTIPQFYPNTTTHSEAQNHNLSFTQIGEVGMEGVGSSNSPTTSKVHQNLQSQTKKMNKNHVGGGRNTNNNYLSNEIGAMQGVVAEPIISSRRHSTRYGKTRTTGSTDFGLQQAAVQKLVSSQEGPLSSQNGPQGIDIHPMMHHQHQQRKSFQLNDLSIVDPKNASSFGANLMSYQQQTPSQSINANNLVHKSSGSRRQSSSGKTNNQYLATNLGQIQIGHQTVQSSRVNNTNHNQSHHIQHSTHHQQNGGSSFIESQRGISKAQADMLNLSLMATQHNVVQTTNSQQKQQNNGNNAAFDQQSLKNSQKGSTNQHLNNRGSLLSTSNQLVIPVDAINLMPQSATAAGAMKNQENLLRVLDQGRKDLNQKVQQRTTTANIQYQQKTASMTGSSTAKNANVLPPRGAGMGLQSHQNSTTGAAIATSSGINSGFVNPHQPGPASKKLQVMVTHEITPLTTNIAGVGGTTKSSGDQQQFISSQFPQTTKHNPNQHHHLSSSVSSDHRQQNLVKSQNRQNMNATQQVPQLKLHGAGTSSTNPKQLAKSIAVKQGHSFEQSVLKEQSSYRPLRSHRSTGGNTTAIGNDESKQKRQSNRSSRRASEKRTADHSLANNQSALVQTQQVPTSRRKSTSNVLVSQVQIAKQQNEYQKQQSSKQSVEQEIQRLREARHKEVSDFKQTKLHQQQTGSATNKSSQIKVKTHQQNDAIVNSQNPPSDQTQSKKRQLSHSGVRPHKTVESARIEPTGSLNRVTVNSNEQKPNVASARQPASNATPSIQSVMFPITPAKCTKLFGNKYLTDYEKTEIMDFPQVYYFGLDSKKIQAKAAPKDKDTNKESPKRDQRSQQRKTSEERRQKSKETEEEDTNFGYDDSKGNYRVVMKDHIAYRYELVSFLGKGSFGVAVKCFDHKTKEYIALKIIKNKKKYYYQAGVELKILHFLKENDPDDTMNIIHMKDYVIFRKHLCISFELMSINLYEFLKLNDFEGLSLGLIRRFAIQLLYALKYLKENDVIHCDLKPENILLKDPSKSGIKIIDFGSSCFQDERVYTYIQSRFYRAPEIILGIPYTPCIDMWSFGCIMAEFAMGYPIFPGEDETDQLSLIMEICGIPSTEVLKQSQRKTKFFDDKNMPKQVGPSSTNGKVRKPGTKILDDVLGSQDQSFVNFIERCLEWDPTKRMSPDEAIRHQWILEGLPPKVLIHHQKLHGIPTKTLPSHIREARVEFLKEQPQEMQVEFAETDSEENTLEQENRKAGAS